MSLHLIIGCMYSGKTTELVRIMGRHESIGRNTMLVNSAMDTRCEEEVKTHANVRTKAIKSKKISQLSVPSNVQVVGIDEGQFFEDLIPGVRALVHRNKHVVVAGLVGDYKQEAFQNVVGLIPIADNVTYTRALCSVCRDGTPASFSKRLRKSQDRLEAGAAEMYSAVCRTHL